MTYSANEIFYTLQGEGANAGCLSVFCRFAGSNLRSGREEDRSTAIDFVGTNGEGGGRYASAEALADAIEGQRPTTNRYRQFVVLTGGGPLLQVDEALTTRLDDRGFSVAVETNGTVAVQAGIDWICVSRKVGTELAVRSGNELKLVFPQVGLGPAQVATLKFDHYCLQLMDGIQSRENTARAIEFCKARPHWSLSVQAHKTVGIR